MDVIQDYLDYGCTPELSGLMVILQDYLVYSCTPGLSGLGLYSRIIWVMAVLQEFLDYGSAPNWEIIYSCLDLRVDP